MGSMPAMSTSNPSFKQMVSKNCPSSIHDEQAMNAAFEHLPLELRFEIASQISAFDDFTNFRHMDRPNFSLLPFYGVANTFLPTDNEKAFVNWISSQLSDYYSDNHLVSSVIERYDPEFEGLAMPLRYERKGDTEDGFAEYCRFLEKAKQVAVRRTPASTVKPRGISITHSSYDMACLKLERLRTFLWHPDGFIFNDTTRQQLDDWCMAVEETFRLASRFHHLPANEFSFHKAVAEVLVHHIRDLYDRFFEPEANWEDEHVAFEGGQDLVFWIQELFTFVMRVRAWDDLANGIEVTNNDVRNNFLVEDENLRYTETKLPELEDPRPIPSFGWEVFNYLNMNPPM